MTVADGWLEAQGLLTLALARERTVALREQLSAVIAAEPRPKGLDRGVWVAIGSVGREECLPQSDVDLILIYEGNGAGPSVFEYDAAVRQRLRSTLRIEVSKGEEITPPTTVAALVDPARIGGKDDHWTALTRRALLIMESAALNHFGTDDEDPRTLFLTPLLDSYVGEQAVAGAYGTSLMNDLARYYRTVLVDFKKKVEVDGTKPLIRLVKLLHSRKVQFASVLLALAPFRVTPGMPRKPDVDQLRRALCTTSPARLREAVQKIPVDERFAIDALRPLDRALLLLSDDATRASLEQGTLSDRSTMPAYAPFRETRNQIGDAFTELILAAPPEYQRFLLNHAML